MQHKPEECTVKAKPGDTVAVHYTVRGNSSTELVASGRLLQLIQLWIRSETAAGTLQGALTDGTVFDSSVERGDPISFKLGQGQVIKVRAPLTKVYRSLSSLLFRCFSAMSTVPSVGCVIGLQTHLAPVCASRAGTRASLVCVSARSASSAFPRTWATARAGARQRFQARR